MTKTKITAWTRIEEKKDKEGNVLDTTKKFNHISDGWDENDYPSAKKEEYSNQKAWKEMKWEKRFAFLKNHQVIYV